MAWTVQTLQDQVQLLTGHDGLASSVVTWTNRVMMEIANKAFWPRHLKTVNLGAPVQSSVVSEQWINNTAFASLNIMAVHRMAYGSTRPLEHRALQDFYSFFQGGNANYTTGEFERYCIPKWISASASSEYFMYPMLAVHPISSTTTDAIQMSYLEAPEKFDSSDDYNWILTKYPQVILAGVLRYAFLYIGDGSRYGVWKGNYINGLADMVRNETTTLASTPAMRAIYPEQILRGGM